MAPPQWAYQVEHFVSEPDEELVCSICRAVFCDPVMCPCDHVFCRGCISKWLQNNRNCPICRKRASFSSIKQIVPIIKNLIMKLQLNCHNKTLGCKAQFSLENSESHIKECEYELVRCKNKPCKDRLFRKDIMEHETSDCPHRYIKCQKCGSKMPTTTLPEKHDCIRALQLRLRRKISIIRKRNNRIKDLRNELKTLKTAAENSAQDRTSSSSRGRDNLASASLSPDEIMINIADFDSLSSSLSSESDDSSDDSIIIFTNSPLDHTDDDDSFSVYMDNQDSVEYSRNESPVEMNEYRNAESQTLDDLLSNDQQNNSQNSRDGNSSNENDSVAMPASASGFREGEERSESRRPPKRRPTTQKAAKRRYPPALFSSDDDDESKESSPRSPKRSWCVSSADTDQDTRENDVGNNSNSSMEAGPSSSVASVAGSSSAGPDKSSNTKWQFRSKSKKDPNLGRIATRHASDNSVVNANAAVPSRNAVFERTLALLEQYNLESDPEWLPEYASHRGNDTTTESDSSINASYVDGSSSSELSDSESNDEENMNENHNNSEREPNTAAVSEFMHWMFESTSEEDDPDWDPISYLQSKRA